MKTRAGQADPPEVRTAVTWCPLASAAARAAKMTR